MSSLKPGNGRIPEPDYDTQFEWSNERRWIQEDAMMEDNPIMQEGETGKRKAGKTIQAGGKLSKMDLLVTLVMDNEKVTTNPAKLMREREETTMEKEMRY
eukprot:2715309-Ditylum_brightwellii.AAC.1